jgi:hypothetical protein
MSAVLRHAGPHLAAPELFPDDDLFGRVDPVNLEHVLGDIQTDRGNLHVDGSPHVIRSQRSPYGTSLLGAGAVHHIRLGHGGMSALSPFYPQLRTLVGAAGTATQKPTFDAWRCASPLLLAAALIGKEKPRRGGVGVLNKLEGP